MITDQYSNFVHLSARLSADYPGTFKDLTVKLGESGIGFKMLDNTEDIWCRDYMPIQVDREEFVQFRYDPDYLEGYSELKTCAADVYPEPGLNVFESDIG